MMVVPPHAYSADETVKIARPRRLPALRTNRQLRLQQIPACLARVLAREGPKQTEYNQVESTRYAIEVVGRIENGHLRKYL